MNIPKFVKIGGTKYRVEVTDQFTTGSDSLGEMNMRDQVLRVRPCGTDSMFVTLIHEILHAIWYFNGYTEHDEKQIDELANALYMVVKDNPRMFESEKR